MRSNSLNYMPALDGLRGVAVAMVFVQHAFPGNKFPGGLGVDIFFVISGFLITRILLKQNAKKGRIALGTFYVRRLLRLYPALLLMVFTFLALWFTLGISFKSVVKASIFSLTYVSNIIVSYTSIPVLSLKQTWSLAMEEQFYLVWPLLLILMLSLKLSHRMMATILIIGAAIGFVAYALSPGLPYSPITRSSALIVGCVTAILVDGKRTQSKPVAYTATALIVLLFIGCTLGEIPYIVLMVSLTLLLPFVLTHLAFGSSALVHAMSARWIVYFGVISYAVYLWHYPILQALRASTQLGVWWTAILAAVLTLTAAILSQILVETPFNKLKDRIGSKRTLSLARG